MNGQIEQIIRELLEIDPSLHGQEASMKKTIENLMREKPETGFDDAFKSELKERLLKEFGHRKPYRSQTNRIYWSMAALFLVGIVSLSLWFAEKKDSQQLSSEPSIAAPVTEKKEQSIQDIHYSEEERDATKVEPRKEEGAKQKWMKQNELQAPAEMVPKKEIQPAQKKDMETRIQTDAPSSVPAPVSPRPSMQLQEDEGMMLGAAQGMVRTKGQDKKGRRIRKPPIEPTGGREYNTEGYAALTENEFLPALSNPLSTFSIDVDTASYANTRRFLMQNRLPPIDAVRIEELINYFDYHYPLPEGKAPFGIHREVSRAPWNPDHKLVMIALQGRDMDKKELPPSNLVFLLDVSGSMNQANKLPLLKESFKMLVQNLDERDRVAIVVYAGAAGLVLPSTSAADKETIFSALERLEAGGSTAGGAGIALAYQTAVAHFIKGGNNRVILATDGDFNVGASSDAEMGRLIESYRNQGVFLTVLGFGMGNYKDSKMEILADRGNGNYAYIDSLIEARKVLTHDLRKTLFTIAKDVKIQVEFNPTKVSSYRLIGYENRLLKQEDFRDDRKDAGEIGAGHSVTVFYEIIPAGKGQEASEALKYQDIRVRESAAESNELLTVRIRYKQPNEDSSQELSAILLDRDRKIDESSSAMRFASAVAEFGMLLRQSQFKGTASFSGLIERARGSMGDDPFGSRHEFTRLAEMAAILFQNRN